MKILSIETSCDETAVAILECSGDEQAAEITILGNAIVSQIDLHRQYGGVFPMLAKREHAKNLAPLLHDALTRAGMYGKEARELDEEELKSILRREPELSDSLIALLKETKRPDIDVIAVTYGPGLEPALWVGVNFAKALRAAWDIPVVPIDHMEGHTLASLGSGSSSTYQIKDLKLPVLSLLISGGHTELVLMKEWLSYSIVGNTRDDAVGEAYDKVARMMDLPYPGGPEISKLAEEARQYESTSRPFTLPRPMIDANDCDFSFSGLKTAVLYLIKEKGVLTDADKRALAREFEDAVADVLWKKTARALEETDAKTLVVGGGVSANQNIRRVFAERMKEEYPHVGFSFPPTELSTDNAVMIGIAGYFRALRKEFRDEFVADGNLSLA
jgi:N6-L-threonylcarbamoyladenine synthase